MNGVWQGHEHHKAMMDRPDYPQMVGRLTPYLNGELKMNHVEFNSDTATALSSPITGVLFFSLKEGFSSDEMERKLELWTGTLGSSENGHPPVTWGPTHEDPNKWIVLIGWNDKRVSCG